MNFRYGDIFYGNQEVKVLTYDELVLQAIKSGENNFEYHNNTYEVKKREDEFYDIFSNDEKVAEAVYEDDSVGGIKKTGENSYRKIRRGNHHCTRKDSSKTYGVYFFR